MIRLGQGVFPWLIFQKFVGVAHDIYVGVLGVNSWRAYLIDRNFGSYGQRCSTSSADNNCVDNVVTGSNLAHNVRSALVLDYGTFAEAVNDATSCSYRVRPPWEWVLVTGRYSCRTRYYDAKILTSVLSQILICQSFSQSVGVWVLEPRKNPWLLCFCLFLIQS